MRNSNRNEKALGFTLFELIVVLAIIAAMVTVMMPYASRSNKDLKAKQASLSLGEIIKYAIDLTIDTKKPTRIVIDAQKHSYWVEIAKDKNSQNYQQIDQFGGNVQYLGQDIYVLDAEGFDVEDGKYVLVFNPEHPWPQASISLSSTDTLRTIRIHGRYVEIEDSSS